MATNAQLVKNYFAANGENWGYEIPFNKKGFTNFTQHRDTISEIEKLITQPKVVEFLRDSDPRNGQIPIDVIQIETECNPDLIRKDLDLGDWILRKWGFRKNRDYFSAYIVPK